MKQEFPILEYDPNPGAVINPSDFAKGHNQKLPERCVIAYFRDVLNEMENEGLLELVDTLRCETIDLPIYKTVVTGEEVCLVLGYVGAAGAAGTLDELIALGLNKFIVCGGAGVLQKDIAVGHLILPETAVRDEGASYHYLPPSREVACNKQALQTIAEALDEWDVPYRKAKTWTTDGFYRETPDKVALRKEEGCVTVEMEAAAYFAVSQFRDVVLGQILYGGDDLSGEKWDKRDWNQRTDIRRQLVEWSLKICTRL